MTRKTPLPLVTFIFFAIFSSAQNFGGTINFKKVKGNEVVDYVYYVKGDKVRFDEFKPGTKILSESFIMNVKTDSMTFLDPDRKLYGTRVRQLAGIAEAGCIVVPATETKQLLGYKCFGQTVTNATDSTQITFYIADGKFAFFLPMVKLINSRENFSTYFFDLAVADGSMPLLAIEKDLNGNEKERLEVTSITSSEIPDSKFLVPKGYSEVK